MTLESLRSLKEQLLTSQEQFQELLPSQLSEHLNTLGTGGETSVMESIDTLMQWYDTLSTKQKVKFWTLNLDFLMLGTPLGTPSRELN